MVRATYEPLSVNAAISHVDTKARKYCPIETPLLSPHIQQSEEVPLKTNLVFSIDIPCEICKRHVNGPVAFR